MSVHLELDSIVAADPQTVFDLSLSIDAHLGSMAESGERAVAGITSGRIGLGQEVTWSARHFGILWRMTSRITALHEPARFVDEQVRGPFAYWHHEHRFEAVQNGTRVLDKIDFAAPLGPLGRLVERAVLASHMRELIETRNRYLKDAAEEAGPTP